MSKKRNIPILLSIPCRFLLSFLLILLSGISFSAEPVFNPFSVEPGLVGRGISNSPAPFVPRSVPSIQTQPVEKPTISGEAAKISFVLNKVMITGNHVFTTDELQAVFTPYMHKKITVAKLQELVQAVTDKYQKAGYFLSKALLPPQAIKNGLVQVRIVEGFISKITVQGLKEPFLVRFIEKFGARIEASKPIKLKVLERYLLLMNDVPGFTVKSVIAPDPKTPLGANLTLLAERRMIEATVTQDNYQTRYLGPNETSLFSSINSPFIAGGTIYGRVLQADENRKIQYYEMRHDQVLGSKGLVFSVDAFSTTTNPQFILRPLEIFGISNDANATLSYPLIRSRERSLYIMAQFDYMNNSSTALQQLLYKDTIRNATVGFTYNDVVLKGEDFLNVTIDKGLNILNADPPVFRSRLGASSQYLKIVTTLSRNQFISERFSAYGLLTAQYANAVLPAAETFIYGGPYIGRGYDWAQFTGDKGIAGKAEFRMNTAPDFPFMKQVQYYVFYDGGQVINLTPFGFIASGASVGVGARAMVMKHINAEWFVGKPLTAPNATQVILGNSGHALLSYFQVTAYL